MAKSSYKHLYIILWKNFNEYFGQPSILNTSSHTYALKNCLCFYLNGKKKWHIVYNIMYIATHFYDMYPYHILSLKIILYFLCFSTKINIVKLLRNQFLSPLILPQFLLNFKKGNMGYMLVCSISFRLFLPCRNKQRE